MGGKLQLENKGINTQDEIDLVKLMAPLLAKWKLLLLIAVLGSSVGFIVSRYLPKTYQATAMIFVQHNSQAASLLRNLPVSLGSSGDSSGYLLTLLQSETISRKVIKRLDLLHEPAFIDSEKPSLHDALDRLQKDVKVVETKKGGIKLIVKSRSPKLAADIANSMLDTLGSLVVTASAKKVEFISERLDETSRDLAKAEDEMTRFLQTNDITSIEEETKSMIRQLTELDGKLLTLDEEIKAVSSELENSGELSALVDREVRKKSIESSRAYVLGKREELHRKLSTLPTVTTEYARIERNLMVLGKTYELLTEQHQLATITQKGEDGDYQIVDKARINKEKVAPRNMVNAALGGFLGLMLGVMSVYFQNAANRSRKRYTGARPTRIAKEATEPAGRT
jgi:uncharacterized protein involved in exopolysaccharide biosynthesis